MNWRTDKPTADVIVASVVFDGEDATYSEYQILKRCDGEYYTDYDKIPHNRIVKWADLEEDKGANCPQKQRGRPRKVYEYPVDVPNNDGCLEFKYMTNATIRKKLLLKKGERAIISIRKEQ